MKLKRILAGKLYWKLRSAGEELRNLEYRNRFRACGDNVRIGRDCELIPEHMVLGHDISIGAHACMLATLSTIYIGNHVVFGPNVTIRGGDHRIDLVGRYMIDVKEEDKVPQNDQDVRICDDVWIGGNVIILKGVTIGEGAVVGAGSVVTKDVPPYTVHVGVHEPMEKPRFTPEQIREHKKALDL